MVKGIEKIKEHFGAYKENYVIIDGTACEVHEDAAGQKPRATKDIDMILIIEALSHDFVAEFWKFVKAARYEENQVGEKREEPKQQYYRFNKPSNPEYPTQIELFSRRSMFSNFHRTYISHRFLQTQIYQACPLFFSMMITITTPSNIVRWKKKYTYRISKA